MTERSGASQDEQTSAATRTVQRPSVGVSVSDVLAAARSDLGRAWALVLGVLLVALGLLGFVPNPLVGTPGTTGDAPLLARGDSHAVVHLVLGAVALHAALGMSKGRRDPVLVGIGVVSLVLLVLGILDGRWFGLAAVPVSLANQLLHLVVGLGSLVIGLAGMGLIERPRVVLDATGSASTVMPVRGAAASDPGARSGPSSAGSVPVSEGDRISRGDPMSGAEPASGAGSALADAADADGGPGRPG
ncbi:MAG: DUF4383 domain-containing protein [Chloroflexi bacterium]|nr:DUF4383 domain-containing protein [Chloroflexota bacterium]